jgi:hypothetical protein
LLGAAALSPDVIMPARKRAATLPPTPARRSPTIPPPGVAPPVRPPPKLTNMGRPATAVRPAVSPFELDNMTTNPPPIAEARSERQRDGRRDSDSRRDGDGRQHVTGPGRAPSVADWSDQPETTEQPVASDRSERRTGESDRLRQPESTSGSERSESDRLRKPESTSESQRAPQVSSPEPQTLEMPIEAIEALAGESGRTQPSMPRHREASAHTDVTRPRIIMPLVAPASNPGIKLPADESPAASSKWASGLASRIDAALDDDFGTETPVVAPTKAELRALLGNPDPTRKQSIEEIQARVEADRRRANPSTTEVDPDDIESAIEIAPPARRGGSIGVAKKKPE